MSRVSPPPGCGVLILPSAHAGAEGGGGGRVAASDEFGEAGPCGAGAPSARFRVSGRVSLGGPGAARPWFHITCYVKALARRRGRRAGRGSGQCRITGSPALRLRPPAGARGGSSRVGGWGKASAMPRTLRGHGWGKLRWGGRVWNWVWAPWRTGGRLFGRRLQGGHPCLAGWRLRRRRGRAERGGQFGPQRFIAEPICGAEGGRP